MKGQFEYYGMESQLRKELVKEVLKQHGKPELPVLMGLTGLMWSDPHREMQYAVMDISTPYLKKMDESFAYFYDRLIGQKSWWDTVDWLAPRAMGTLMHRFPGLQDVFIEKWMQSGNKWYIRSALLFQMFYRKDTNLDLLFSLILRTVGTKEFFINKASGWALRQYSKTEADPVKRFVEAHPELHNLTKKEALKWLERQSLE